MQFLLELVLVLPATKRLLLKGKRGVVLCEQELSTNPSLTYGAGMFRNH